MVRGPKKKSAGSEIRDEPGAEERFLRGVRKALKTPPTKHADEPRRGTHKKDKR